MIRFTVSEALAWPPLLDFSVTVYVPSHGGAGNIKLNERLFCALKLHTHERRVPHTIPDLDCVGSAEAGLQPWRRTPPRPAFAIGTPENRG